MNTETSNINLVKRLYSFFANREINSILELLSTEVEWGEPENPYNPAGGRRYGHKGFLEWVNIGREAEDILELKPEKMLADIDTVAVIGNMKCLAKPTGKIYESDFVHVIKIKNGRIEKFQEFFDTYAAGEAFRP